jgi:TP901 family phage tail tape measure protein
MSAGASATDEFAQAGLRLQKVGLHISNLGDSLTKNVTLPLALAGGAAIKMATDFDAAFVKMQTLAGVSADSVDGLKDSVLDLSGQTGRAPQELAEALYFLQSSGLDSAEAMEALESSAKASAIGLGDTATVADAVSSAMLGYAESGLEAAEATDILIATARAGKAEPAELAGQMGRLIPIASELGISFDQVGGAVAALSTKGNSAEMATTQLVNVMSKLLKPSEQASKLLEQVGLSADGIRQMLAEKGLLGTLEELQARLGDAGFTKFLEDTQAIQGALGLLGGDLNKTKDIFDQVKESAGATDSAFATWAESMGAQNAQAFAQFQVALIKVGEVLAPIASDVLNFISKLAGAFSDLPSGAQQAIIAFAGLAAAMGPVLSITGRLITGIGTAIRLMSDLILPAGSVSGAFNTSATAAAGFSSSLTVLAGAAVGLAALLYVMKQISNETDGLQVNAAGLSSLLTSTSDSARKTATEFISLANNVGQLDEAFSGVLEQSVPAAEQFIEIAEAAGVSREKLDELRGALEEKKSADVGAAQSQAEYSAAVQEATGATDDQAASLENAKSALQEYADALQAQFDPLFGMRDALAGAQEAQLGVTDAQNKLNEAMAGGNADEIAEAQRNYDDALRGASDSLFDVQQAQLVLNDAIRKGDVSVADAQQTLYDWAIAAGYTHDQAIIMAGGLGSAADAAIWLGQQNPVVDVAVSGKEQSISDIRAIQNEINALQGRDVGIRIVGTAVGAVGGGVFRFHEGGVVPGRRGEEVAAILQAGETVVPLDAPNLVPMPAGPFGGGGAYTYAPTYEIHGNDPQSVIEAIQRYERNNGPAWRN